MPGVVPLIVTTGLRVLPYALCSAFSEQRAVPVVANVDYPDGRYQARAQAATSRKGWSITQRMTVAQWATLLDFYDDGDGPVSPFFFYPLEDDHDPTGASATGRWLVRFEGSIQHTMTPARSGVQFKLLQVE